MYGLRQRLMQPRHLLLMGLSGLVLVIVLALSALTIQSSAAHSATRDNAVTFNFMVTVAAGTPPSDVQFWVCPDAQADGTGCDLMTVQPNGSYIYQLATTTGMTYQHITIEWSDGQTTTANGSIPTQPVHVACDYANFTISNSGPYSLTCKANFAAPTVTPTVPVTPSPTLAQTASATPGGDDTGTLITGLQVIIGVGLVLFVLLLIILIWQRASAPRKR